MTKYALLGTVYMYQGDDMSKVKELLIDQNPLEPNMDQAVFVCNFDKKSTLTFDESRGGSLILEINGNPVFLNKDQIDSLIEVLETKKEGI